MLSARSFWRMAWTSLAQRKWFSRLRPARRHNHGGRTLTSRERQLAFERLEDRVLLAGDSPSAADDGYYLLHDTVLYAASVLDNDYDPEYDPLTASLSSGPSHGSLDFRSDGTFTYTPATHFVGHDSFVYTVSDGTGTANATVHIDVSNGAPSTADDEYVISHDHVLDASQSVLFNDYDSDNDALAVSVVTGPSHGSIDFRADGTFVYTPDAGFVGMDTFVYAVSDGIDSTPGTATIYVLNDAPYASDDYGYGTLDKLALTVTAANGVLANDFDYDDVALCAVLVSSASYGSISLNADGSFTYTPDEDMDESIWQDSFSYRVWDGHEYSGVAYAYIDIGRLRILSGANQYYIGEKVSLRVEVFGAVNVDLAAFQWTVSASAVAAYYQGETGHYTGLVVDDLDDQSAYFHWVTSGEKSASVVVTVVQNGQQHQVPVARTFTVLRPQFTVEVELGDVHFAPEFHKNPNSPLAIPQVWEGSSVVQLGNHADGEPVQPGISMTITNRDVLPSVEGSFFWTPLVSFEEWRTTDDGREVRRGNNLLDGRADVTFDDGLYDDSFRDSPGYALLYAHAYTVHHSFTTYLMFKSALADSIPVAVHMVSWGWGFEAVEQGDEWDLVSSYVNPSQQADVEMLPTWEGREQDVSFEPAAD